MGSGFVYSDLYLDYLIILSLKVSSYFISFTDFLNSKIYFFIILLLLFNSSLAF